MIRERDIRKVEIPKTLIIV
jgi:hypothetical protein